MQSGSVETPVLAARGTVTAAAAGVSARADRAAIRSAATASHRRIGINDSRRAPIQHAGFSSSLPRLGGSLSCAYCTELLR